MTDCTKTRILVGEIPNEHMAHIPPGVVDLVGGSDGYKATSISGLTRPDADIDTIGLAGANASHIGSARIQKRNIVLSIVPQDDGEGLRQKLYDILPFDTMLRFYIITENREVYIDGKVEKISGAEPNGNDFTAQISILCPFPWFQSVKPHSMKLKVGENKVPYVGDIPAGFKLEVPNSPLVWASVTNLELIMWPDRFAYSGTVLAPRICTIPGQKSFTGTSSVGGNTLAPALSLLTQDSEWLRITKDTKTLTVSCASGSKDIFELQNAFEYRDTFSGV